MLEKSVWKRKSAFACNGGDNLWQSFNPRQNTAHQLCRPCERRLKNFEIFRVAIKESQSSFQRVKRCIEILPSVARTLSKSEKDSANSRRGKLGFEARTDRVNTPQSSSGKEVDNCRLSLIYLRCVFACVHNLALFNIRAIISLIQRGQIFLFTEWPTKNRPSMAEMSKRMPKYSPKISKRIPRLRLVTNNLSVFYII